jgi:multiple sugar transport system permease protein
MGKALEIVQKTILYVILLTAMVVVVFPFIWLISSSLKAPNEVFAFPPDLLPKKLSLENFYTLLTRYAFARWLFNSLVVALSTTVISLLLHSMAGYALARLEFPGRNLLFLGIMSTYMLPLQAIIVPRFLLVNSFGWVDTYQGLIIPSVFHAFGIFAFRQFFLGIPKELEDAAIIDGCSRVRIYWTIVLPLSRGIFLTLGVILFMANWDAFLWPLLITRSSDLRVAQIGISTFMDPNITLWQFVISGSVLTMIPGLVLFFALQRYIVRGIKTTGIRG